MILMIFLVILSSVSPSFATEINPDEEYTIYGSELLDIRERVDYLEGELEFKEKLVEQLNTRIEVETKHNEISNKVILAQSDYIDTLKEENKYLRDRNSSLRLKDKVLYGSLGLTTGLTLGGLLQ